jgi:cellulose synthase/poly-beta-1,6-N-acetylglucosamine synthase-like glycosyltransferase
MFLLIFLLFVTVYYLGAVTYLFRGLHLLQPSGDPQHLTYSIVIAARNEEANIARCLDGIFSQTIPSGRFEVIVVNDRSTDATAQICARYAELHPAMSVITIAETPAGVAPKKYAVSRGVEAARHEIIVQTDADCTVGTHWLETIDRNFGDGIGLVQGITTYARPEGMPRLFYGLQAVDFLSHGIVAAAAIGAGMPINSNANNFAFRKKAFEGVNGYGTNAARVVSGDDDLLLQRIAQSKTWKAGFMIDPKGAVLTMPTMTPGGVFNQRKRWGSKTVNYTAAQVVFLSGIFLFYCGILGAFGIGFINPVFFAVFAGMLMVKACGELLLMVPGTAMFNQRLLRPYIVAASLIQLPMVLAAVVFGVFGRFSWKGEKFRRAVK